MKKFIFFILILILLPSVSTAQVSQNCFDLRVNLKQGQRDSNNKNEIISLQNFLKDRGYLSASATGFFGIQTLKAVKAFQRASSITPTGFVGPQTRLVIKNISCRNLSQPTTGPVVPTPEIVTSPVSNPTTPVVPDEVISSGTQSSLKIRTEGVVNLGSNLALLRGRITAGARSGTLGFFEVTTNPLVYKTSETIISSKVSQRSNDKFEISISGLKPETSYYFRACAENPSLGQKSCGGTSTFNTVK